MRLKDFFIIDPKEKVTDKKLTRVLIVSVCGILLTMAALVQTTWALFSSELYNTGNVITVGNPVVRVALTQNGSDVSSAESGEYSLNAGECQLNLTTQATQDYVILTVEVGETSTRYCCDLQNGITLTLRVSRACTVTFVTSWAQPSDAAPYNGTI